MNTYLLNIKSNLVAKHNSTKNYCYFANNVIILTMFINMFFIKKNTTFACMPDILTKTGWQQTRNNRLNT